MAGESAREVARRAREKAERLNKRAELFEQGAEGEAETARVLATLPPGWTVLHDLRWPGRRLANVDHVVIGPSGIFVIDSKNWTGRITTTDGLLRQNGYNREKAVAAAADAALAVAERSAGYAPFVHGVISFAGREDVSAWCRDVAVCCTANLFPMLMGWPVRLTPEQVADASTRLDLAMRSASEPAGFSRRPASQTPVDLGRVPGSRVSPASRPRPRSRRSGPSLGRFLVGGVLLLALISVGPQLASGIGTAITEQMTKNIGDSTACNPSAVPPVDGSKSQGQENKKNKARDQAASSPDGC